ncbi:hypothetical protein E2562_012762 [Oryza meyeriana var. granulata]|uniref:Leucine-rich repeat-containing N-terminal plant-type domain-containing protein n=1 Tax=Oryza meyeriana var. granulata TaxID=110450 RepID=A0A6G1DH86_9ORYZ|nr:hypothetical protein E2562_012762 [Oryza meyeriana var. granulata]
MPLGWDTGDLTGKLAPEARNFTALARLELFENLISSKLPSLARLGAAEPLAPRRQPTSAAIWIGDRRLLLLQFAAAAAASFSLSTGNFRKKERKKY